MRGLKYARAVTTGLIALLVATTPFMAITERAWAEPALFEVVLVSWGPPTVPPEVGPGDVANLNIALQYQGWSQLTSVVGNLTVPSELGALNNPIAYHSGLIQMGRVVTLEYLVQVSKEATPGDYTAVLRVQARASAFWKEEELEVTVSLSGKPTLDAQLIEHETHAGKAEVNLIISNNGSAAASEIRLELTSPQGVFVENPERSIEVLDPDQHVQAPIKLWIPKTYELSAISLTAIIDYKGPLGAAYNDVETLWLFVKESPKPLVSVELDKTSLTGGSEGELLVTVVNMGSSGILDVSLSLNAQYPLTTRGRTVAAYRPLIEAGDSWVVPFEFSTEPVNTRTTALVTVDLEYRDEYGYSGREVHTLLVIVKPTAEPRIELSMEPKRMEANTESALNITVSNAGSQDVYNISVRLDVTSQLIHLTSTEEFFIAELHVGELAAVTAPVMTLYTTATAASKVTVQVSYRDSFGRSYVENAVFTLLVVPREVERKVRVEIIPEEFQIGKENEAVVKVTNTGPSPVIGLEINLEGSPPTRVFGSSRIYVDSLKPNETREYRVRIYVPATAAAATTTIGVMLSYLDTELGLVTTDSLSFSMLLRGFIELKMVDYAAVPKSPRPGQPFSITVTLTNTGTSTAYAAYAFPVTRGLPLETFGPKSVYIGNVEVNIPTTFTINLMLHNTTLSELKIPVTITYMDNLRTLQNVTYELHVEVSSQPTTQEAIGEGRGIIDLTSILTVALPAAAAAGLGAFLFRRFRKRE